MTKVNERRVVNIDVGRFLCDDRLHLQNWIYSRLEQVINLSHSLSAVAFAAGFFIASVWIFRLRVSHKIDSIVTL